MADMTDSNNPLSEAEQAHQAALAAARERLARIEAAMDAAQHPVVPQVPTPPPVTPSPAQPTGFKLTALKNPTPQASPVVPTPQPQPEPAPAPTPAPMRTVIPELPKLPDPVPLTPKGMSPLSDGLTPPAPPQPAAPKPKPAERPLPSRIKPLISAVIVFFVVLGAFKAPIFYYQLKYLFSSENTAKQTDDNPSQVATAPTLTIPKINVTTPVVFEPSIVEAQVQKALESGVVHYGNTAKPGEVGNTVIFGHSSNDWDRPGDYKFIFVLLEKLNVGDTYSIDYEGQRYEYKIYERSVILPTDVHVVQPTAEPTSTLITCWPVGTTQKRFIVKAKQISPEPSNDAIASNQEPAKLNTVLPGADSNNGVVGTVTTWIENIRSAIKGEPIEVNEG